MSHLIYTVCYICQDTERSQQSELAILTKEKDVLQEKLDETMMERDTLQAKFNLLNNQSDKNPAGTWLQVSHKHNML